MDHFQQIYAQHADRYEALVLREDYQGNILKMLESIRPLAGLDVVEFGAGTGRLTALLAPSVRSIRAYDSASPMLAVASAKLQGMGLTNWKTAVAPNDQLPEPDASADMAIQGWSFGHSVGWYPDTWRDEIGRAIGEMRRVLRPGGTAVMFETMTTGSETPHPPTPGLDEFYRWLETEQGYHAATLRTDYRFESLAEAETLVRFFFGDELADAVVRNQWQILPECTGIWWRTYP